MRKQFISSLLIMTIFVSGICQAASYESEPNNDKNTSDVLVSGVPLIGQLMQHTDEDWYSISSEGNDLITVHFQTVEPSKCDSIVHADWIISVFTSEGILLNQVVCDCWSGKLDHEFFVIANSADVYNVVVTSGSSESYFSFGGGDANYTLTTTISKPSPIPGCYSQADLDAAYAEGYAAGISDGQGGLYTQEEMDSMVNSILTWGDIDGDKKIDLREAIHALQVTSGIKSQP